MIGGMGRVTRVGLWGLLAALGLTLSACPPRNRPDDGPSATQAASPLEIETAVTGKLRPGGARDRYLVKVVDPGPLTVRMSWNDQDGLDRVLVQGGTLGEIMVLDGRERQEMVEVLDVGPGFYTLELVPGARAASYDLIVAQARP